MRPVIKEGHAPQPYNIETSLVYAVACILSQWKEEVNREKESLTQRLIEEGRNKTIIGNLFSQWKKRPRPEEKVTGILNEIEEKNREIMTLSEQMNDCLLYTSAIYCGGYDFYAGLFCYGRAFDDCFFYQCDGAEQTGG